MGDACQTIKLPGAYVQENGIIRKGDGRYIGRLDEIAFEDLERTEQPLNPQIENNFKYHPADSAKGKVHDQVRSACKLLAYELDKLLPNSREKSLAMTKLEEVMMWANAGVARN